VSDGSKWVNAYHSIPGLEVTHFDRLPRIHGNLNTSGILLAGAAKTFAPCLVITLDVEICGQPEEGDWMDAAIALGRDPADRKYKDLLGDFPELNCAVQWCGAPEIGDTFLHTWNALLNDRRAREIPFWEQVVWSVVWKQYADEGRAKIYPKELNWSHWWGAGGVLRHYHGSKKWHLAND
jgi:hypothetical protein